MGDQRPLSDMAALLKKQDLEEMISKQIPDFKVRFKDTDADMSWWLRQSWNFTGKTFNKRIWTHVTTTVYPDVWFPDRETYRHDHTARFSTLAHEFVHLLDIKERGFVGFTFLYGFPQTLALGAILSPLGFFGFLWAPLFWFFAALMLLFTLIPFGGPWRSHYEERGYTMTMCCRYWSGRSLDGYPEWMSKTFTGSGYWYMRTDEQEALQHFRGLRERIENGDFDDEPIFKDVREVWFAYL